MAAFLFHLIRCAAQASRMASYGMIHILPGDDLLLCGCGWIQLLDPIIYIC